MRGSVAICARLSTWNTPMVSAALEHAVDRGIVGRQVCEVERDAFVLRGPAGSPLRAPAIMPRPSRSTLMMPRSAQSSLSHCMTTRPGIAAGSSGTTSSRRPAAITMPPECWPRWRGRSWICAYQRRRAGARAARRDRRRRLRSCAASSSRSSRRTRSACSSLASRSTCACGEAERLADLAHGAARAVGDDVGGHRGAALARSAGRRTG